MLAALIAILPLIPQILAQGQKILQLAATMHNAGAITLSSDQIAAMNAAGVSLTADIAALEAAAGTAGGAKAS